MTERQRILLREADEHLIYDSGYSFYRVGGKGTLDIRYNSTSYQSLMSNGLVTRQDGGWKTTEAGRAALRAEREGE